MDVTGATYNGTITLAPYSSAVLINNGALLGYIYATPVINDPAKLTVKVFPNPTSYSFTLRMQSQNNENLKITVVDIAGRSIEKRTGIPPNSILELGNYYYPGIYVVIVSQGNCKVIVRLIKEGK